MFPPKLYKAFSCEEHAYKFVEGEIRFSTLAFYGCIEDDNRNDRSEGSGQFQRDGEELIVNLARQVIDSRNGVENVHVAAAKKEHFICCFSSPKNGSIESLPKKFGDYYVLIKNPIKLYKELEDVIKNDSYLQQTPTVLDAAHVRYDKGAYIDASANNTDINELAWMQKPEIYFPEEEFRFHFRFLYNTIEKKPLETYTLKIGKNLEYCEILHRSS